MQESLAPMETSSAAAALPALKVVAVAASAGGLEALGRVFAPLPADFPAAIVVVLHIEANRPSQLAHILGRQTSLGVKQAEEGDLLQAGWISVAPPGKHLLVNAEDTLSLSLAAKEHFSRPAADVLFRSVAASCGTRAIGVVLTGGDGDGASGMGAIKAAGGTTIAQDEATSQEFSMPHSAIATGDVDFVLAVGDIAAALVSLVNNG